MVFSPLILARSRYFQVTVFAACRPSNRESRTDVMTALQLHEQAQLPLKAIVQENKNVLYFRIDEGDNILIIHLTNTFIMDIFSQPDPIPAGRQHFSSNMYDRRRRVEPELATRQRERPPRRLQASHEARPNVPSRQRGHPTPP